jgi:hypothetical protein
VPDLLQIRHGIERDGSQASHLPHLKKIKNFIIIYIESQRNGSFNGFNNEFDNHHRY